jgi:parvulin-like peptidyl-prolyl isomerase
MMKVSAGSIYQPVPIYKGYGVLKVLATKPADESAYTKLKYSYQDKVVMRKKYEGLENWIKKLKQQANIKIYRKGG